MKNDNDMDLYRLFDEVQEPECDEQFVGQVVRRIARRRWAHRIMLILLGFSGTAMLAALTPWLITLTGQIALGTSLLASTAVAVTLSPAGCAIGGGLGLFIFLKVR